jgi:hypothetical protein
MFNAIKKISMFLLFITVLLWLVAPSLAQDSSPAIIVLPEGTPPPEFAIESILKSLYAIAYLPFAGALVEILTQAVKPLPFLKNVRSSVLVFFWTVAVWLAYLAAQHIGYGSQFPDAISAITTIAAMILGVQLTPQAAGWFFNINQTANPGVLGYSRTPTMAGVAATAYKPTVPVTETFADGDLRSNG